MRTRISTTPGIVLGLALVSAWLVAWHLLSNAAGLFALATALFGLICLLLSSMPSGRWPAARTAFGTAARVAMVLAVAAAFSLGAFIPAKLAEWASPALGRFGGLPALL